jgi:hypothetical protein
MIVTTKWRAHFHNRAAGQDSLSRNDLHNAFVVDPLTHTGHVEPVDILPKPNPLLDDPFGVAQREHHPRLGRSHDATVWFQEAISGMKDRIEHRLVQKRVPHPLGNDHIDLRVFRWELNRFYLPSHNATRCQYPDRFGNLRTAYVITSA